MFRKIYNYCNLSYYIWKYYQSYNDTNEHNVILLDQLVKYVHNCGSVMTKFCQWITPLLEIMHVEGNDLLNKERKKPLWLQKLEVFYENCHEHDIQYTYTEYERVFHESFTERFTILKVLGSGSIGQVYLIEDKHENQFVMKILHPNVISEIRFFRRFFRFIYFFPCIRNKMNRYLPVDINQFIISFEQQSNFMNEANNLLRFNTTYQKNDLIIIPDLYKVSSSILIMSYEEGTSYDDLTLNQYHKFKLVNILNLFIRNNWGITNFNHGDIHKGNWKVRVDTEKNKHKLVFYDYGFCFELPKDKYHVVELMIEIFESSDEDKVVNTDLLTEIMYCIIISDEGNVKDLKKTIKGYILKNIRELKPWQMSPVYLVQMTIQLCIQENKLLNHVTLQFLILSIQVELLLDEFGLKASDKNKIKSYTVYRERYLDIIALCKTYNIFPEYKTYLQEKLNEKQPDFKDIFDTIQMPESIQLLAIS